MKTGSLFILSMRSGNARCNLMALYSGGTKNSYDNNKANGKGSTVHSTILCTGGIKISLN